MGGRRRLAAGVASEPMTFAPAPLQSPAAASAAGRKRPGPGRGVLVGPVAACESAPSDGRPHCVMVWADGPRMDTRADRGNMPVELMGRELRLGRVGVEPPGPAARRIDNRKRDDRAVTGLAAGQARGARMAAAGGRAGLAGDHCSDTHGGHTHSGSMSENE